jgi:predicted Zn-dependent protease
LPDLDRASASLGEADWQALLQRFAAIQDQPALIEFWRALPSALEAPFIQIVAGLIEQAQSAGDDDTVSALQVRLEGFKAISAQAAAASSPDPQQHQSPMADLQAAIETFQNLAKQANNNANNLTLWQQATQAGEAMLEKLQPFAEHMPDNELEEAVAQPYNSLGIAQDDTDKQAALHAFERAMALHPQQAMYRHNYAGTLIDLGQLALAEQAIAQAQHLEPNAPRLTQLRTDLAQARAAISA